jgi:CheY-like chemotaxis protein
MSSEVASEPPLSLPPEMLRELSSAGLEADQPPNLEQWQTLLLRFAHRFRDEPTNPLQFASSALGHDLRTPMTVVIGASELLLEGSLDPEQRLAAENVHRSGQQLLGVIDQFLSEVTEKAKSTPPPPRGPSPIGFRLGAENQVHRVLLAEDNEFNRMLIERVLRTLNCDVDAVSTGREAVRKFHQGKYDLVLMDCHMPDLDGLEATRQIRAVEGPNRRVPILAVTAGTVPGARQACLHAGMDDFIAKPFSLSTLRRKTSHWLSMSIAEPSSIVERPLASSAEWPATAASPSAAPQASVDLSRLQQLAEEAGSPRIVEELSLIFVEDMERRLESLREAADERGERQLLNVIHSVKGACGNFGALRMAVLSERMEKRVKRGDLLGLDLEVGELWNEFQTVRRVLDLEVFGIRASAPLAVNDSARVG